MSAVPIIVQALLASEEVTTIVGSRIFPIMAPQNALRPYTIVNLIDNEDPRTLRGASSYFRSICQLDHYAEMTPDGAITVLRLGDAAIEALNGIVKADIAGCTDVDVLLGSADFTESGNLEANTHRRYTQFLVRYRRHPGAAAEPPDESPVIDEWAFTVTAGSDISPSGTAIGYSGPVNFQNRPSFGSVPEQPIDGYALQACYRVGAPSNNSIIAFTGDVSALLAGKSVWVNGVNYGLGDTYKFAYAGGVTIWNRLTGGPAFVSGQSYSIEIK